jgi:hypothetical protein
MANWNDKAHGGGVPGVTPFPFYTNNQDISVLTAGADQVPVAGTVYFAAVYVPHRKTITSIGYLIGSVGGTDKAVAALYNAEGKPIATSALAGVTVGTAATVQELTLTTPIEIEGPGYYYVSISLNGTTARLRVSVAGGGRGGSAAGAFGTIAAITPPTASAASLIGYVV